MVCEPGPTKANKHQGAWVEYLSIDTPVHVCVRHTSYILHDDRTEVELGVAVYRLAIMMTFDLQEFLCGAN